MNVNSTLSVALVQSALVGGDKGHRFNDSEDVGQYPAGMTINVYHPISRIEVFWDEVIDGLRITYNMIDDTETVVIHGRTNSSHRETVTLAPNENIVVVSGRAGDLTQQVVREPNGRVFELDFVINDRSTGRNRVAGPYGNPEAVPFCITANGIFVAFGGFADNADPRTGDPGTIYGLTFIDIDYRQV